MRALSAVVVPAILAAALSACTGPTGPVGATGPTGPGKVLNFPWGFTFFATSHVIAVGSCDQLTTTGVPSSTLAGDILVAGPLAVTSGNAAAAGLSILAAVAPADGTVPMVVCNFTSASIDLANTAATFNYRIVRP